MPTVHLPASGDLPPDKRAALERLARRERVEPDDVSLVHRVRLHWPEYLEASTTEGRYNFKALRRLPEMTKQGIHVTVSAVNRCEF